MYISKNIIEDIKLSNLSKKPPCPGRKLLESLILFFLLKNDWVKSPTIEKNIIKLISITKFRNSIFLLMKLK